MEIGQKVKVFRIRDRVSKNFVDKLGRIGVITGYKMTDGSGVGAVVEFEDHTTNWFFDDELKLLD